MEIQARIPSALAGIHNFIFCYDPTEVENMADTPDPAPGDLSVEQEFGLLARGAPTHAERTCARDKQDRIAQSMWESYLAERGMDTVEGLE